MSKKAMKLALEFIEQVDYPPYDAKPVITALLQALANEALDKKAENARELGLDYEPAQYSDIVSNGGFDPRTRRTWVGLTEADWKHLYDEFAMGQELDEFAEAIEAKLKEKNT